MSDLKIRPLSAKVIVRLVEPPQRRGLIHLPEAHLGRTSRGTVVSVGPGREHPRTGARVPPGVRPGDHVVFTPYADVPVDGSPSSRRGVAAPTDLGGLVAVSQEEILCVLEGACCPYPEQNVSGGPCASCRTELRDLLRRHLFLEDWRAARAAIEWWYPGARVTNGAGAEFTDEICPPCHELSVILPAQAERVQITVTLSSGAT